MMTTLQNRVSALFADPLQMEPGFPGLGNGNGVQRKVAPLSIWEGDQSVYLELDVPGIALEDLAVVIYKGCLTIKGRREFPAPLPDFSYQERFFGEFKRSVFFNDWVDPNSIEASLRNGVLSLKLAKKPEAQRQTVAISYGEGPDVKRIEKSK